MESKPASLGTTWLGLTLVALATVGLMARLHPQQAQGLPASMEAAAADVVIKPVLEASTQTPSPAQDGIHHRRPALSMPYFSFARLLRPGS